MKGQRRLFGTEKYNLYSGIRVGRGIDLRCRFRCTTVKKYKRFLHVVPLRTYTGMSHRYNTIHISYDR